MLIPHRDAVLTILRRTGALREGHFRLPNGAHTDHYFQIPLALREYGNTQVLTVALSRLLRLEPEVRTHLREMVVVAPASGGIPVAYGVGHALRAAKILWAERGADGLYFRQYGGVEEGDVCVLVDDILLTGNTLAELAKVVQAAGGRVLAAGVLVDAGVQATCLEGIPISSLARFETAYYPGGEGCHLCAQGVELTEGRF